MDSSDPADVGPRADSQPRIGPVAGSRAGDAYLVVPDDGPGHGVLVLHSWWGLTRQVKELIERLADAGYTALAPDLLDGVVPTDAAEAEHLLRESDPNATQSLIMSSLVALRAHSRDPQNPVAVIGFSMGASWALWLGTRLPADVDAVVAYYGAQNIDFDALSAPVLGHFAETDPLVTEDELVYMHSQLLLSEKFLELHRYPGTGHWFAEEGIVEHYDAGAAELAWQRTLAFLEEHTTD